MKSLKSLVGLGKEEVDAEQLKKKEDDDKLMQWKAKLQEALSKHDEFRAEAAVWDEMYNGSKRIASMPNAMSDKDRDEGMTKDARQVVNLTYQLIESQIDTTIPMPRVDPLEQEDTEKNDMVEGMLTSIATSAELERLNSENERIAKKNSLAIYKVYYDPTYKEHNFAGKIRTTNPHPCNFIPQPGIHRIEDMDYCFQIENRTLDYICRTYGEDFRSELEEEAAEFGYLESFSATTNSKSDKGMLSVVEAWYKDQDGDVGVLTWCNECILKDTPKFYFKRDEMGNPNPIETLEIESPDPLTGIVAMQTIEVEAHVPKRFPYVALYNIPKEKSFIGISDPHIMRDQQEGIKKMISMQEEKLVKGTTKIFVRKNMGLKQKLTNAVSQVLEVDDPQTDINVVDLKTPDQSFIEMYQVYVQAAKDVVGITEASQGRAEGTSLSGKALEALAQYTAGRISVKTFEKQAAFKELYQLYYDFLLAFYDDKIPFKVQGEDNKPKFGVFDKTKLLKQDVSGSYYYPKFDIYISAEAGIVKDKNSLLQQAQEDFRIGAIDTIEYWSIKERLGFPNASIILQMEKEKLQMQQQLMQQQAAMEQQEAINNDPKAKLDQEIASLPEDMQEYLMNMNPEDQQKLLDEYMSMQTK